MMQIWFLSNGSYSLKNCHNPFGKAIQPPPPLRQNSGWTLKILTWGFPKSEMRVDWRNFYVKTWRGKLPPDQLWRERGRPERISFIYYPGFFIQLFITWQLTMQGAAKQVPVMAAAILSKSAGFGEPELHTGTLKFKPFIWEQSVLE